MDRPSWATFIGVIMLLIGGCGSFDNIGDMRVDKILEKQDEIFQDIAIESSQKKAELNSSELDSNEVKVLEMLSDSIVKDSSNQPDLKETIKSMTKMSPYRIMWMKRFAYVGFVMSLLYILSGILFLSSRKWVIQLSLLIISVNLVVKILEFIIYRADSDTSKLISSVANIENYVLIVINMVLIIIIMVMDKSYYFPTGSNK